MNERTRRFRAPRPLRWRAARAQDIKLAYLSSATNGQYTGRELLALARHADVVRMPAGTAGRTGPWHRHVVVSGAIAVTDAAGAVEVLGAGDAVPTTDGPASVVALSDAALLVFDPRSVVSSQSPPEMAAVVSGDAATTVERQVRTRRAVPTT